MFPHPVEQQRRDQCREHAAQRAARAHRQIEQSQVARAWPFEIEATVQRGRKHEQHEDSSEPDRQAGRVLAHHRHAARQQHDDRSHAGKRIAQSAAFVESEHEA